MIYHHSFLYLTASKLVFLLHCIFTSLHRHARDTQLIMKKTPKHSGRGTRTKQADLLAISGIQLEAFLSTERTEVQASLKYFFMPKLALPTSSNRPSVRELRKQGAFLENLFPGETQALPFIRQLFLPMMSKKIGTSQGPDFLNTLLILVPFSWKAEKGKCHYT